MSEYQPNSIHPRHLRERFATHAGKRVNVGLTTGHYLCGTWKRLDNKEATFGIGDHEMPVKLGEISSLDEAPAMQAEFFK